jgi:rhodanese-related sulfurtransferase
MPNPVTAPEAADPATALRHFAGRLAVETDVADVAAGAARGGDPGFVLLDARSPESYAAGHLPGARLLARPFSAEDVAALGDSLLVVYCWGPACNGATKAARELAALARPVKEMLGGFEYWERDGHAVERGAPSVVAQVG